MCVLVASIGADRSERSYILNLVRTKFSTTKLFSMYHGTAAGACQPREIFMNFLSVLTKCSRPTSSTKFSIYLNLGCRIGSVGKSGELSGALSELKFST
jgi:hypothetical protein